MARVVMPVPAPASAAALATAATPAVLVVRRGVMAAAVTGAVRPTAVAPSRTSRSAGPAGPAVAVAAVVPVMGAVPALRPGRDHPGVLAPAAQGPVAAHAGSPSSMWWPCVSSMTTSGGGLST